MGKVTHGRCRTPEHNAWCHMKCRCNNLDAADWKYYGGRGISVCARWDDSFAAFLADMGPKPSPRHSLDRINVDGDYEPSNCRWATHTQQMRNTRINRIVEVNGQSITLSEAIQGSAISYNTVHHRINMLGWDIHDALSRPLHSRQKRSEPEPAYEGRDG